MTDLIFADVILVIHFLWVIFMIGGFVLTLCAFRWKRLFEWFWLRTIHVVGIVFVATLEIFGWYCPLTTWEMALRQHVDPNAVYAGSFVIHWIERLIYPDVSPLVLTIPAIAIAAVTVVVYVVRPPERVLRMLGRNPSRR